MSKTVLQKQYNLFQKQIKSLEDSNKHLFEIIERIQKQNEIVLKQKGEYQTRNEKSQKEIENLAKISPNKGTSDLISEAFETIKRENEDKIVENQKKYEETLKKMKIEQEDEIKNIEREISKSLREIRDAHKAQILRLLEKNMQEKDGKKDGKNNEKEEKLTEENQRLNEENLKLNKELVILEEKYQSEIEENKKENETKINELTLEIATLRKQIEGKNV